MIHTVPVEKVLLQDGYGTYFIVVAVSLFISFVCMVLLTGGLS